MKKKKIVPARTAHEKVLHLFIIVCLLMKILDECRNSIEKYHRYGIVLYNIR